MIVAAQLVFVCIWWGAASSKLNRHFPFVVTVMISNTPWNRSKSLKQRLYRNHPEDLLPSETGALAAHMGTVIEFTLPLILLLSQGGTIGTLAAAGMIVFHLHILSTFPLAVPLEWNVFMIFGILFLFGHYGDVPLSTLDDPLLIADPRGHLRRHPDPRQLPPRPDLVPALDALLRRQLGDEPVAVPQGERGRGEARPQDRRRRRRSSSSSWPSSTTARLVEVLLYKGLAFRSMHSHGRALNGLLPRAVDDVEDYDVREGELVAGVVLGYNFGDGHFHDEALLDGGPGALRVRARRAAGDHARVPAGPTCSASTTGSTTPPTGLVEEGYGRGRRHGRAPALARRAVPERRSARARRPTAPHERGGGRRRRSERAGLRGDAGAGAGWG